MTCDNSLALEIERKELQKALEETSSPLSPLEEARIRKEVRFVMNQQFAKARVKLESNPVAHVNISKSGNVDIIDLISQSVALLQKSQPSVLPIPQSW